MLQQEFEQWLADVKKAAIEDYGYSQNEVEHFNHKHWCDYYDTGLTPFEAVLQHLKTMFSKQNK